MGIQGTCKECGGETHDYECLRCIRRERDALLLRLSEETAKHETFCKAADERATVAEEAWKNALKVQEERDELLRVIGEVRGIVLQNVSDTVKVIRVEGVLEQSQKRKDKKSPCGRCGNILRGPHDEATCDYGNV